MTEKKELKRKRMRLYFIEATQKVISTEGYSAISLRKVADLAGYNGATLYSYFEDLEELILYASLKYLKDYNYEANQILHSNQTQREVWLNMWRSFCNHSFHNPKPYAYIFSGKHAANAEEIASKYYSLYPEDLGTKTEYLSTLLKSFRLEDRNKMVLQRIAKEENFKWQHLDTINEMMIFIYRGLLEQRMDDKQSHPSQSYTEKMMEYLQYILTHAD